MVRKQETVESLNQAGGAVREAIVFVESSATVPAAPQEIADIFAEMAPFMVDAQDVDDSREAVYTRMEGECSAN